MGIEETEKLIAVLKGDILNLFKVDYEKIVAELDDLDLNEKFRIVYKIGEAALEIMVAANAYGIGSAVKMLSK